MKEKSKEMFAYGVSWDYESVQSFPCYYDERWSAWCNALCSPRPEILSRRNELPFKQQCWVVSLRACRYTHQARLLSGRLITPLFRSRAGWKAIRNETKRRFYSNSLMRLFTKWFNGLFFFSLFASYAEPGWKHSKLLSWFDDELTCHQSELRQNKRGERKKSVQPKQSHISLQIIVVNLISKSSQSHYINIWRSSYEK